MMSVGQTTYTSSLVRWLSALCLAGAVACWSGCGGPTKSAGTPGDPAKPQAQVFAVEGMSCEGCVSTVTSAIEAVPGVKSAKVSLAEKQATVVADAAEVPAAKIEAAVSEAGYKAHLVSPASNQPAGTN